MMINRILLVEDDVSVAPLILEVVVRWGYEATLADGLSAVKRLTHFDFSAVITDFQLLDGDACDVIEFMRSKIPGLPAIVTSGNGKQAAADCESRRIANVVFVNKPFRPQELLDGLNALVPATTNQPPTTSSVPDTPSAKPFRPEVRHGK